MRSLYLLPITTFMAAVLGCGPEAREHSAYSLPQRDLALPPQAPAIEIASPVELGRVGTDFPRFGLARPVAAPAAGVAHEVVAPA